jgi:hypothetical protein
MISPLDMRRLSPCGFRDLLDAPLYKFVPSGIPSHHVAPKLPTPAPGQ